MKKVLFIAFLGLFSLNLSAQADPAPQQDMEDIMEEMMKSFGDLEQIFGGDIMIDTMMIQQFGNMDDLGGLFQMDPKDMDSMIKQLDEMMQQFNGQGMGDLEELFKGLGLDGGPMVPAPDQIPDADSKDKPTKKKKKRKTYSM